MQWSTATIISAGLLSALIYVVIQYLQARARTKRVHKAIISREGCKPLKRLPNSWLLPFGLDKLQIVIRAERERRYPVVALEEHERHGDTYSQVIGLGQYVIITRDPRNVRTMLSRQFKNFIVGEGRHGCVRPLLGDGIFTQDGDKWERSRKLLFPLIHKPTISGLDLVEKHFQRLLKLLESRSIGGPGGDLVVDMKEPLFAFTLGITTEFLLGQTSDANAEKGNAFAEAFNTAFRWISKRERLKAFYWMIDGWEFRASCRQARKMVADMIEQARLAVEDGHDEDFALAGLLRDLPREEVTNQFMGLLLAGRDTSASLLCWLFYSMAREPKLAQLVREEVTSILGDGRGHEPTRQDLGKMMHLDRFITETLRLFPPVPLNCRFAIEDTFLPHGGGADGESPVLVPTGTLIAYSAYATQNSKALYSEDARKFNMDRWTPKTHRDRTFDWSYQTFSGGPRKCLGERFALEQAKYLTCRFLQHFSTIEAREKGGGQYQPGPGTSWVEDVKYHVGLTMSPDDGVWVRLASRG